MRLDLNCVREILLFLEGHLLPDADGDIEPIMQEEIAASLEEKYDSGIVIATTSKMVEEGLLIKGKAYIRDTGPRIKDITLKGYSVLDTLKPKDAVQKILPVLMSLAPEKAQNFFNAVLEVGKKPGVTDLKI